MCGPSRGRTVAHMTDRIDIRAAFVGVAVALVGCALLVSPGTAAPAKKPRVVVSPKPGQPVREAVLEWL
jgi:hypothetical protein